MGISGFQISPKILPSITGGVATLTSDGDTTDTVVRHTDEALYDSNKSGRNMVARYEPYKFST
jgi:PleD family two-component response regulator